jgi:hypothetical protein
MEQTDEASERPRRAASSALSSGEAQAALVVDVAEARALLLRLVDEGLAEVEGQKRGTRYVWRR